MNDQSVSQFFKPGPDCLPVDELASNLNLPAGSEQRRAVETHVGACPHCHNELELLHSFESGAIREEEREAVEAITARLRSMKLEPPKNTAAWWRRLLSPPGFAAALAVAAALIVAVNLDRGGPAPIAVGGTDTYRSTPLRALSPLGEVAGMPQEFTWTQVTGASTYSVNVTEVDRTPVFSEKIATNSVAIPSHVRNLLQTGKILQWNVIAYGSTGQQLASTAPQRVQFKVAQ